MDLNLAIEIRYYYAMVKASKNVNEKLLKIDLF
jgi:hypothetical protein